MAGDRTPLLVLGGLGLAALGIFLLTRGKEAVKEIPLSAGWNEVTYTGSRKKAGIAMQSIMDYLEIAYYYDAFSGTWQQVTYDTVLEPGMLLNLKVSQDCVWRF